MTEYLGIVGVALCAVAVLRSGSRHVVRERYFGETGYMLRGHDIRKSMRESVPRSRWCDPLHGWLEATVARRRQLAEWRENLLWVGGVLVATAIVVAVYLVARGRV